VLKIGEMLFDDNDPKYLLACCCRAHVRTVSIGVVCFSALLSIITCAGALYQLATNSYDKNDLLPLVFIFVSLLTIGAVGVWALAVRSGRWHLMLVLHIALAVWAIISLGGAVLFAFALANGSDAFMQKVFRLAFGANDHWSSWATANTYWMLVVSFALLTVFFVGALFVLLTYYGYVIAKEEWDEKFKAKSWKIGRTSISMHPVAQLPDDTVKDIPFSFAKMPTY